MSAPEAQEITNAERGYNRKPTPEEKKAPPFQTPWTEFTAGGDRQDRPDPKACGCYFPFLIFDYSPCSCLCCVLEMQWPEVCGFGESGERCCDVVCRCRCQRARVFLCCGPQCNDVHCCTECKKKCACCTSCKKAHADRKLWLNQCCDCCNCSEGCVRYGGCVCLCAHFTCALCPAGCENVCCFEEERLMMDGDLRPVRASGPEVPTGPPAAAV